MTSTSRSPDQRWTSSPWLVVALLLASTIYTVYSANLLQFLLYTAVTAGALGISFAKFLAQRAVQRGKARESIVRHLPTAVLTLTPVAAGCLSLVTVCIDVAVWLVANLSGMGEGSSRAAAGTAAAIAVMGVLLFGFRKRYRLLYGVSEAVVGITAGTHRAAFDQATGSDTTSIAIAVITAGVYLVVRGLDNISQALSSGNDPTALWLRRRRPRPVGPTAEHAIESKEL